MAIVVDRILANRQRLCARFLLESNRFEYNRNRIWISLACSHLINTLSIRGGDNRNPGIHRLTTPTHSDITTHANECMTRFMSHSVSDREASTSRYRGEIKRKFIFHTIVFRIGKDTGTQQ